jgi:hypothetical protein
MAARTPLALAAVTLVGIGIGPRGTFVLQLLQRMLREKMDVRILGLAFCLLFAIYYLPWFIARAVQHPRRGAIFVLNCLLGWTIIGWVAALVWALTGLSRRGWGTLAIFGGIVLLAIGIGWWMWLYT